MGCSQVTLGGASLSFPLAVAPPKMGQIMAFRLLSYMEEYALHLKPFRTYILICLGVFGVLGVGQYSVV